MLDEYDRDVVNWLVTDEYSTRTGGLFKPEFLGYRMISFTAKCYFVEGKSGTKFGCKGMSKKQNEMTWKRYMTALNGELDIGKNTWFRVHEKGMVTYEQNKLGLSAYYDKRGVLGDGIHTRPIANTSPPNTTGWQTSPTSSSTTLFENVTTHNTTAPPLNMPTCDALCLATIVSPGSVAIIVIVSVSYWLITASK